MTGHWSSPPGEGSAAGRRVGDAYQSDAVVRVYASSRQLSPVERVLFDAYVPRGARVLDLGVGAGRTAPRLAASASRYVGIDISPPMIAACRSQFPWLDFRVGDAADLSAFGDASFDAVVFSYNGLDHLDPPGARVNCLRECRRVLAPGGHLIVSRANPRAIVAVAQRPGPARQRPPSARQGIGFLRATLVRCARQASEPTFWAGRGSMRLPASVLPEWAGSALVSAPAVASHLAETSLPPQARQRLSLRGTLHPRDLLYPSGHIRCHAATPSHVAGEVTAVGLDHLVTLGSRFPRHARPLLDAWYYLAFRKPVSQRVPALG